MDDTIKSTSIILKNENGEEKVYYKLSEFTIKNKENNYLLYTDYSKTDDRINIYYGIFENNILSPVTDENDVKIIKNYINRIENDIQNGMKF